MRTYQLWAFAQLCFGGHVNGIKERQEECEAAAAYTKTVYIPTTVYATLPSSSGTGENYCSNLPSSSASSSVIIGNFTLSSGTASRSSSSVGVSTTESLTTATAIGPTGGGSAAANTSLPTGPFVNASTSAVPTLSPPSSSVELPVPTGISGVTPPTSPPPPFRGYKNAVYFTNWGTKDYQPQELPVSELTHILYAFADIGANGTVMSSDPETDLQRRYPLDSPSSESEREWGNNNNNNNNAYGVVKQLFLHKQRNRNLKTLLSIGGWAYSPKFAAVAATEAGRQTFARSAVKLVTDWGFDGIDVDWEYPATDADRDNFVKLLEACRRAFDAYAFRNHLFYRFAITVASPASATNAQKMDLRALDRYVDSWHLMAYDYSGSWDPTSGHQANVFASRANAPSTKLSTDDAVSYYEGFGVDARKILMGLPLYGRAFEGTSGLGQNYSGVGAGGGEEPGVYFYRDLPRANATERWDEVAKATWSYDPARRELVSYDNVRSATYKAGYIAARRLGGAFFWEARGDKTGEQSLVNTMAKNLGDRRLDETLNNLHYPTSVYDNIRSGMVWG
ncbi:glycoside hydrolase superfamily [Xylariomycetidae sp. FL2044]|nr:glycoside hydrolase superfamily [Xylariomycetidae sp. FL2044]